jgi:hypothetical protein
MIDSQRIITCGLLVAAGCGTPAATIDAPGDGHAGIPSGGPSDGAPLDSALFDGAPLDVPGHTPGMPGLGAHAMTDHHVGDALQASITIPAIATRSSGSMIVVGVGRGDNTLFRSPTDNKGNAPYQLLDGMHPYAHPYEASGTAMYQFSSANGGSDFQVSTTTGIDHNQGNTEEITLTVLEIIEGTQIDQVWNLVTYDDHNPVDITSKSITTTGPATLIAFWYGDAFPGTPQSATPNNDFVPIKTNAQETGSFVQCAVAVKNVTAPGTYDVTWTSEPKQGAQLWLIAVQ